ncbi:hypothetical protein [Fusibacter sp. JL216-2]|uniref:hypothetical protein n=1 Tax=Fusibacter sp. JL216-2 TaxID=3071453 RepID=UPI003D338777
MKFKKRIVFDQKLGEANVYVPCAETKQLRFMDSNEYHRVVLGNAIGYSLLKNIFLIASKAKKVPAIFHIQDNSLTKERYMSWFKEANFQLDFVVINRQTTQIKPKHIKKILKNTANKKSEIVNIEVPLMDEDLRWWNVENCLDFKTYSKYIICSANEVGFQYLAHEASKFQCIEDYETNMCDDHSHINSCNRKNEDVADFWYYYESKH